MIRWNCYWEFTHRDAKGKVIWQETKKNAIVDQGEEIALEVLLRGNDATYLAQTDFWMGLYQGTISETTTLLTVPGEPSGNNYSRVQIERSSVGWPTKEFDEGDWRFTSKVATFEAVGGDIGPFTGAFLCTSSDNTGGLYCFIASSVERTILAGESVTAAMKVKCK